MKTQRVYVGGSDNIKAGFQGMTKGWMLLVLLTFFFALPAYALDGSDVTPGSACSVEDSVMMTAKSSGSGGYILTCESGFWVATLSVATPTADEHVATKAYVDAASSGGDNLTVWGTTTCPTGYSSAYTGEAITPLAVRGTADTPTLGSTICSSGGITTNDGANYSSGWTDGANSSAKSFIITSISCAVCYK